MSQPHTPDSGEPLQLIDAYGRRLNYLRLSLTDRCNLHCRYCMPAQGIEKLRHEQILTLEELARVSRVAVSLGVDKIRLTGGEPLLRRNLAALLNALDSLRPRPDLRLTTNGQLLSQCLPLLLSSGVSTINVSLDTLRPERFGAIAGLPMAEGMEAQRRTWRGIEEALASPGLTVKINVVLLAGFNQDELVDFARLTMDRPLSVRFIEYMPVGRRTPFDQGQFFSSAQALERIGAALGPLSEMPMRHGDGPAQRYRLPGAKGELGMISALTSHFCATCNRLRLSAEGLLVPCLFSEPTSDIKALLRGGASDQDLAQALLAAAALKPRRHAQSPELAQASGCQMSHLGG